MTVKGVKLKSEGFHLISWRFGVMEENLRGKGRIPPPGIDGVKD